VKKKNNTGPRLKAKGLKWMPGKQVKVWAGFSWLRLGNYQVSLKIVMMDQNT
jgi:hypothetical protein